VASADGRCLLGSCEYIQFPVNVNLLRGIFWQAWYKAAGRRLCLVGIADSEGPRWIFRSRQSIRQGRTEISDSCLTKGVNV